MTPESNVRVERERIVLPSELQTLRTLTGFLRLAGYPVAHVQLKHSAQRHVTDAMLERGYSVSHTPQHFVEMPAQNSDQRDGERISSPENAQLPF